MTRRTSVHPHEDKGAALILAISFVVMVGAIAGGLAALATSGLTNRSTLENIRNREYAAEGAIEEAVSTVRALAGSPFFNCGSTPAYSLASRDGVSFRVDRVNDCGVVQAVDGTVVAQRNVIFSACEGTAAAACTEASIIIRARINFQQGIAGGVTRTYVQSWSVNR